jgi:aldose 1-epimerase
MMTPAIQLEAGRLTLGLDRRGAVITRFSCLGADGIERPLMRRAASYAGDPLTSGCFPMLPFGNRVRGNRFSFGAADYALEPNQPWDRHYLHGDGWLSVWEIVESAPRSATLAMRRRSDLRSPYAYEATLGFVLSEAELEIRLCVLNVGAAALPFGLGLHPFFPLTPHTMLQASARRFFSEEAGFMPGEAGDIPATLDFTTAQPLPRHWINNGFAGWDGQADILWPEHGLGLRIRADGAFEHYFLFVSDRSFEPGFKDDYFCFEPMTHAANGHHAPSLGGLAALAPGQQLSGTVLFQPVPVTAG